MKNLARLIGSLAMIVAILDTWQLIQMIAKIVMGHYRFHTPAYVLGSLLLINGMFCGLVIFFGALSWVNPLRALRGLRWSFIGEIVYFVIQVALSEPSLTKGKMAETFGASFGVGGVGMYLQTFTLLPIWGTAVIFFALRHRNSPRIMDDLHPGEKHDQREIRR